MGILFHYFLNVVVAYSIFVAVIQGAEDSHGEISESQTHIDVMNDLSNTVQHANPEHVLETDEELAETFMDAVYDILQPIQRRITPKRRKDTIKRKFDDHKHLERWINKDYVDGVNNENYINENRNGDDILQTLLEKLEDLYHKLEQNTTSMCINDTGRLVAGLLSLDPWAIQFLDSTGKPGPALTKLHLNLVGDYEQCRAAAAPAVVANSSDEKHRKEQGFSGNYCVVEASSANAYFKPQIGLCFPSSCSSQEVTLLLNELIDITPVQLKIKAECRAAKTEVTTATVFAIIIIVAVGVMMILGTSYDLLVVSRKTQQLPINSPTDHIHQNGHAPVNSEKNDIEENDEATPLLTPKKTNPGSPRVWEKLLLAFSVYSNGKKVLNTSQAPGTLGVIHGIRFLSISWVVMCHIYLNVSGGVNGLEEMSTLINRWTFLAIANGFVSVDTFFTLSGLLTSYLTIKEMNRKNTWNINWPMFYFHRFWRLTPPYMFSIVLVLGLTQYFGKGPMWQNVQPEDKEFCERNWWTNLLYVNNLVRSKEMCIQHSWYLANDMQFFILSPFMIVPFFFHRYAGMLSCLGFLFITTVTTGALSSENDWLTTIVSFKPTHFGASYWFNDYYIKPWCRIGPFIVGIFAGYILAQTKGRQFRMSWFVVTAGWITAFAAGLAVVYGLRGDITGQDLSSTGVSAFYNAVNRSVWGACISWVIIACSAGYGGPIHVLLSWSPFVVLGRLTYMSYLVHLCIVAVFFGNLGSLLYINDTTIVVIYLGLLLFVNMVAFVLVLALESPMLGLEKAILGRGRSS